MLVTGLDKSWVSTPFLRHRWTVTKPEEIEKLRECGVQFVDVETEDLEPVAERRTPVVDRRPVVLDDPEALLDARHPAAPESPVLVLEPPSPSSPSFEEELTLARQVYRDGRKVVEECLQDVRIGKGIKVDAIDKVVDRMVDSVLRNLDAAVCLSRLKSADHYSFCHSVNTAVLALAVGVHLKLGKEELHWLGIGALLHDIGNAQIPLEILNKTSRYQPHEYEIMKEHTLRGADLLSHTRGLPESVVLPALEHHERMDGTGYPFQRRGKEVSLFGRIVSIVDIYDGVTTDHVYQKASAPHRALQLLYGLAKRQTLDQELVERLIHCVGIYPVGSCVTLNTGEIGVVMQVHRHGPLHPKVLVIRDAEGQIMSPPAEVDLAEQSENRSLMIISVSEPADAGINPADYLTMLNPAEVFA